jgi:hypothetical protein
MKRLGLLVVLLFCMTGCEAIVGVPWSEYSREDRVYTAKMDHRMYYSGFSLARPIDKRWFFVKEAEEPRHVMFSVYDPAKPEHYTFYARVALLTTRKELKTKEEFKKAAQSCFRILEPDRHELVKMDTKFMTRQGQWCVTYDVEVWDKKARGADGQKLLMTMKGLVVMHPDSQRVVDASYSERGLPGDIRRAANIRAGDAFLKGIRIETRPEKPAVGPSDEED